VRERQTLAKRRKEEVGGGGKEKEKRRECKKATASDSLIKTAPNIRMTVRKRRRDPSQANAVVQKS
jgi:hypothetical protein